LFEGDGGGKERWRVEEVLRWAQSEGEEEEMPDAGEEKTQEGCF
jgi:hypothetical protein